MQVVIPPIDTYHIKQKNTSLLKKQIYLISNNYFQDSELF